MPTRRYHVDSKYYSELNPIPEPHVDQGRHSSDAHDHYREAERLQREAEREHRETERLHHSYSNSEDVLGDDVTVYAEPIVHHPFKHHKVHHHYHHDHYAPEPVISYDEPPEHLLSYEEFKLMKHERQAALAPAQMVVEHPVPQYAAEVVRPVPSHHYYDAREEAWHEDHQTAHHLHRHSHHHRAPE